MVKGFQSEDVAYKVHRKVERIFWKKGMSSYTDIIFPRRSNHFSKRL